MSIHSFIFRPQGIKFASSFLVSDFSHVGASPPIMHVKCMVFYSRMLLLSLALMYQHSFISIALYPAVAYKRSLLPCADTLMPSSVCFTIYLWVLSFPSTLIHSLYDLPLPCTLLSVCFISYLVVLRKRKEREEVLFGVVLLPLFRYMCI